MPNKKERSSSPPRKRQKQLLSPVGQNVVLQAKYQLDQASKDAVHDSSQWNSALLYHRKLRGHWNDPNTGVTFIS